MIRIRFTPTHVGNTSCLTFCAALASVHPHARGEYHDVSLWRSIIAGSPPRTWGIQKMIAKKKVI